MTQRLPADGASATGYKNQDRLDQEGGDQREDGVEFRVSGEDHRVGLDVVALTDADDTVGADLTLADAGEQADQSHAETDAEEQRAVGRDILAGDPDDEGQEAVQALRGGHGGKDHVAGELVGILPSKCGRQF